MAICITLPFVEAFISREAHSVGLFVENVTSPNRRVPGICLDVGLGRTRLSISTRPWGTSPG